MTKISEGWTTFQDRARKFHYIPADDDRALCGKWALSPYLTNARALADLSPDDGTPTEDDCKVCRRKLDALKERDNA